ncbi:hypothetical protein P5673_030355, partial [Acropora cervicornis]
MASQVVHLVSRIFVYKITTNVGLNHYARSCHSACHAATDKRSQQNGVRNARSFLSLSYDASSLFSLRLGSRNPIPKRSLIGKNHLLHVYACAITGYGQNSLAKLACVSSISPSQVGSSGAAQLYRSGVEFLTVRRYFESGETLGRVSNKGEGQKEHDLLPIALPLPYYN